MRVIKWNQFEKDIIALTTTKAMGNMAFQVGNNKAEVIRNRQQLLEDLDIDKNHLVFVHQSHSDRLEKVDDSYLGKGANSFETGPDCDALYTTTPGIALGIFHADCVPIFLYSKKDHLIAIIHAGYKGTLKEIAKKSVRKIVTNERIDPNNIHAYIGPSLSREFYDISVDDVTTIQAMGYGEAIIKEIDKNNVCVELINRLQLESEGIPEENIHVSPYDTGKDEFLFSAYKNHPVGRMASVIMLKK